jgi:hypothetical protein
VLYAVLYAMLDHRNVCHRGVADIAFHKLHALGF